MTLRVKLYKDRKRVGTIICEDQKFPCYGKSDQAAATRVGNSKRDPLHRNGDTPTGVYEIQVGSVKLPSRTYGKHPVIRMVPKAGDALKAARNGRSGLLIHGGDPSSTGGLRPTYGCLRVSEDTQAVLVKCLREYPDEPHSLEVMEIS